MKNLFSRTSSTCYHETSQTSWRALLRDCPKQVETGSLGRLGWSESDEARRDIYKKMMVQVSLERSLWDLLTNDRKKLLQARTNQDVNNLAPQIRQDPGVPEEMYSSSMMTQTASYSEIRLISNYVSAETKQLYDRGVNSNGWDYWIIRWCL